VLVADPRVVGRQGAAQPKPLANVLFINIDTAQAAATGIGGNVHHPTPNIDQLAAQGAFFAHAFAPSNWTRPSNLAFLTGRYPSEHGLKTVVIPTLPEERRSYYMAGIVALPLHLGRHGYRTHAIVQNNLLEDVWGTGVDVGFAGYHYVQGDLRHSLKITAAAMAFLEESRDERWLLYLSYNAPHFPYRPSREALVRGDFAAESPLDWQDALYRSEVNLTDFYLGPLLGTLTNLGLDRDTLVVVNSDHGEQLQRRHAQEIIRESSWEPDTYPHVKTRPGHETLFDETIRVPLVLRWPGRISKGQRIDEPVAMYDLPVTILDLLELPALANTRGRSLVPALFGQKLEPRPILVEGKSIRGVIDWPFKYIRREGLFQWVRRDAWAEPWRFVPEEIYDLREDPDETRDLAQQRAELLPGLRRTLAALTPAPRFVYFFSARNGPCPSDCRITVQLRPASAVDQVHLLDDTGATDDEDRVVRSGDSIEVALRVGPGGVDRIAFTTRSATASVRFELVRQATGQTDCCAASAPVRAGSMRLAMEPGPSVLSDDDRSLYFDASADPDTAGPGLFLWRIPLVGGIKGRGGKLEDTVEQTFRSWGYVQ
jgi:arylsulfatase A-like enzyme